MMQAPDWSQIGAVPEARRTWPAGQKFSYVQVSGNPAPGGRICTLAFAPGSREPAFIARTSRLPEYEEAISREHRVLEELARRLEDRERTGFPRPVAEIVHGGRHFFVEEYVRGTPVLTRLKGTLLRRHAYSTKVIRMARASLERLQRVTADGVMIVGSATWEAWMGEALAAAHQAYPAHASLQLVEGMMGPLVKRTAGWQLPLGLCHGDFCPSNLMDQGDRLAVVDWEYARWAQPCLIDPLHLAFRTLALLRRQPRRGLTIGAFLSDARARRLVRELCGPADVGDDVERLHLGLVLMALYTSLRAWRLYGYVGETDAAWLDVVQPQGL
jgi:hypothetical protein